MQTTAKAIQFYEDKVKGLEANLSDLEKIVQGKSSSLNAVEEGESLIPVHLSWICADLPSNETKGT